MDYFKLSQEGFDNQAQTVSKHLDLAQAAITAMIGSGFLAHFAVTNPKRFYIDSRADRMRYSRSAIRQAVAIYAKACEIAGALNETGELKHEFDRSYLLPNLGCL